MNGHARHLHARLESIANSMRALERRQQRRVQIQHAIRKCAQHDRRHLAHVTSHNDVFGASSLQRFDNLGIGGFRVSYSVLFMTSTGMSAACARSIPYASGREETT
mgnify:CR=1 FL=1